MTYEIVSMGMGGNPTIRRFKGRGLFEDAIGGKKLNPGEIGKK